MLDLQDSSQLPPSFDHDTSIFHAPVVETNDTRLARVTYRMKSVLGVDVYEQWLRLIKVVTVEDACVVVSAPMSAYSVLTSFYAGALLAACQREWPDTEEVKVEIRQVSPRGQIPNTGAINFRPSANLKPDPEAAPVQKPVLLLESPKMQSPLMPEFTLERFVQCNRNLSAFATMWETAATIAEGERDYMAILLSGETGVGKTHLLRGLQQRLSLTETPCVYLNADSLYKTDQMITGAKVVLFDGLDDLRTAQDWAKFNHLVDMVRSQPSTLLVAAGRESLAEFSSQLTFHNHMHCEYALQVVVGRLDIEARLTVIERKVREIRENTPGFEVPRLALAHIAKAANGHTWTKSLYLLLDIYRTTKQLDLATALHMLEQTQASSEPKRVKIEDIQRMVARAYNVSRADLISSKRTARIVRPRQVAMYLAKTLTLRSLPEIGRRFGGRDHTTVLHAVRKIEALVAQDTALQDEIETYKQLLLAA